MFISLTGLELPMHNGEGSVVVCLTAIFCLVSHSMLAALMNHNALESNLQGCPRFIAAGCLGFDSVDLHSSIFFNYTVIGLPLEGTLLVFRG